jgi:hypothetical protein
MRRVLLCYETTPRAAAKRRAWQNVTAPDVLVGVLCHLADIT